MSNIQDWFSEAKGSRLRDADGITYTLVDLTCAAGGVDWYFGLALASGDVVYVNLDRYDELTPVA